MFKLTISHEKKQCIEKWSDMELDNAVRIYHLCFLTLYDIFKVINLRISSSFLNKCRDICKIRKPLKYSCIFLVCSVLYEYNRNNRNYVNAAFNRIYCIYPNNIILCP